MSTSEAPAGFEAFEGEQFLSITTFRRDGTAASTPVWFVSDDLRRRLFVATGEDTWKVKRIRRDPHVRIAPCTGRGRVTGRPIDGTARFVDEEPLVRCLQSEKYGWQRWLIETLYKFTVKILRRPPGRSVFIEIVPAAAVADVDQRRAA